MAFAAVCACGGHGHGSFLPAAARRTLAGATPIDYAQVVLADGPSAYYRLDDATSVAKDSSPNGYNGTVGGAIAENAAGLLAGSADTAMTFPGGTTSAGVVSFAQNAALQPASAVTLEAWLRFASTPATYTVVTAYGSDRAYAPYDLFFRANGALVAQFYTSAGVLEVQSPTPLAAGTTYHVVSTFDGSTGRLYVNGAQVASAAKTGTLAGYLPGYGFAIGDDAQLEDPEFKGTIDEVAVYAGKVLGAAQILNHYNAGIGGTATTPTPTASPTPTPAPTPTAGGNPGQYPSVILGDAPTAYYALDDTGTAALDASGHAYNGTIGGAVAKGVSGLLPVSSDTAMTFPGTSGASGVVSIPANAAFQPLTNVSLEAWLRFTSIPSAYTVAVAYGTDSFYAPYALFFRANGQLVAQFYLSTGVLEVPSPTNLIANATYYAAATYDGTTGRLYVNGSQVAAVAKSGTLGNYVIGYGLTMGDDAGFSDPAFRGTLDEVALYAGKTLSATQVQNHYAAGTSIVATPTPAPTPTPGVDWATMGFDVQRSGYNPSERTISTANVGGLHALWSAPYALLGGEIGEPVYASGVTIGTQAVNVLYAASGTGVVAAVNADTGVQIWSKQLGNVQYTCGTATYTFGADGTPVIDRSTNRLYVGDGQALVHALDLRTGAEAAGWPVTIAAPADHNFIYGALTLNNGKLYAETSSTCDISPWYGRIVVIDTASATLGNTFYPTQGTSGGGIWGFGGASVDPATNDVYIATGNADGANQTAFYAEQVLGLSADVSTILGNSYATLPANPDADYGATPLLFQPPGCGALVAAVNKAGIFALWNRANISAGPTQTIQMSISSDNGDFVGVPAYDPVTNEVYVGLPSTFGIYKPGVGAFNMRSDCTLNPTPAWNAAFGADGAVLTSADTLRSPITIANGVLYVSDYVTGVSYAFDASSGAQLWSKTLAGKAPVGPIVVNGHLYTSDITGKINAWTP